MDTNKVLAFTRIVELGSFSKAAQELSYTQTAISHMIASLEKELGYRLLVRSNKSVSLTDEGKGFLPFALEMVAVSERMQQYSAVIHDYEYGLVRMGILSSIALEWFPRLARQFKDLYNHIDLQIFDSQEIRHIGEWFRKNLIDLAFSVEKFDNNYDYTPLFDDKMLVVMPANHPLAQYERIKPEMLTDYVMVIPAEGDQYLLGEIMKQAKKPKHPHLDAFSDRTAIAFVRNGFGITVLPDLSFESKLYTDLVGKELDPPVTRTIYLIEPKNALKTPATQAFLSFLKQWLKEALEAGSIFAPTDESL